MQAIIATIKLEDTGPAVANLQDALLLLLDKKIIRALEAPNLPTQEELDKLSKILKQERAREPSFFGKATYQLVSYFQVQQGLGDHLEGVVEEKTAAKLNEVLKSECKDKDKGEGKGEGMGWRVTDSSALTSNPEEPTLSAPPLIQAEPDSDAPTTTNLTPSLRPPIEYSLLEPPVPNPADMPPPAVFSELRNRRLSLLDTDESFLKERFRNTYNLLSSEPFRQHVPVGPQLRSLLSGMLTSLAAANALGRDSPTLLETFNWQTANGFTIPMPPLPGVSWDFPGLR